MCYKNLKIDYTKHLVAISKLLLHNKFTFNKRFSKKHLKISMFHFTYFKYCFSIIPFIWNILQDYVEYVRSFKLFKNVIVENNSYLCIKISETYIHETFAYFINLFLKKTTVSILNNLICYKEFYEIHFTNAWRITFIKRACISNNIDKCNAGWNSAYCLEAFPFKLDSVSYC